MSVPPTSASPAPTPSATTMPSAISRSDQHDCARLRPLARSVTGTPISGRVKDRDINLAGDANRSAHHARRSFKAKAGSRRRHHEEMSPVVPRPARACPTLISAAAPNLFGRSCQGCVRNVPFSPARQARD
jgi:hypothetical protein